MSVSSISFYQQDQSYWQNQQSWSQAESADNSLINTIGQAEVTQAKGLASIANQTALNRVDNEITALVQSVLSGNSTSSSSSSSTGSSNSSSSGSSSSSSAAPATGTGTAPLTTSTPLSSLGILPGGTITVSAGANMTVYTSTGNDTVADLIDALNVDLPTNAQVTASLNSKGQLVITGRNTTDTFVVGGTGIDASAIGFGIGNNTFEPTKPSSSSSNASGTSSSSDSSSSSTASSSTGSSNSSSNSSTTAAPTDTSLALQTFSTAASILSADGVGGTLVDMLA